MIELCCLKASGLQGQEVAFTGLEAREKPKVSLGVSTLKHSKAMDTIIKSPASSLVRALLILDTQNLLLIIQTIGVRYTILTSNTYNLENLLKMLLRKGLMELIDMVY